METAQSHLLDSKLNSADSLLRQRKAWLSGSTCYWSAYFECSFCTLNLAQIASQRSSYWPVLICVHSSLGTFQSLTLASKVSKLFQRCLLPKPSTFFNIGGKWNFVISQKAMQQILAKPRIQLLLQTFHQPLSHLSQTSAFAKRNNFF